MNSEILYGQLNKKDTRYFRAAEKASQMSDFKRYKLGCIAVYNNKIISSGYNSERTNPLQLKYAQYRSETKHPLNLTSYVAKLHAEVDCLHYIINRNDIAWDRVKLYIFRGCKSRATGLARPCSCCMALIRDLGIKHIYYTTDTGFSHEILL